MYEYFVFKWKWRITNDNDNKEKELQKYLDTMGAQGWHVVSQVYDSGWYTWVITLERPKQMNPFGFGF